MNLDILIDDLVNDLKKYVVAIERRLYLILLEYLTDNIDIDENKVKYSQRNIVIVNNLDKTVSKKLSKDISRTTSRIIKGINSILALNTVQLEEFDVRTIEKSKAVNRKVLRHASKNILTKTDLSLIYNEVRATAVGLMSQYEGITLRDLRKQLELKIVKKSIVNKHWSRWTYDIYSQYQRVGANELRKEIGLKHAVYEGGLIETSRDFCKERNRKVFTEEEIAAFSSLDWEGKNEPYDPFYDLGGYNCRHRLRWISEELAKQLRPDLR